MARTQSKEARAIVRELLKRIAEDRTLSPDRSKNELKASRRALGALLFSPDYVGYIDKIDDALRANKPPKNILKSIASASEKLVKSYSFAPGIFEAHHVIALTSLRDNFMVLPEAEQDKFLDMLADNGWELGDTPQQLMNTVQSRPAHIKQDPIYGSGKELYKGQSELISGTQASHGTLSGSVPTNNPKIQAKGATNAAELMDQFRIVSQPQVLQALKGNITDDAVRKAVLEQTNGLIDLYNVDPEMVAQLQQSQQLMEQRRVGVEAGGQAGFDRPSPEVVTQRVEDLVPGLTDPSYVPSSQDMMKASMGLNGLDRKAVDTIASVLRNPAVRAGAIVGAPGIVTMGLSAKAHTQATAEAEADPTLRNRAVQAATGAQVLGDSIDATGAVLSASGVGAVAGVPMMAAGGAISNVGSLAEQVITAPEAYQRSAETVAERTDKTEEEVKSDPLGYGSLFDSVTSKLGEMSLSGYNSLQSAFR